MSEFLGVATYYMRAIISSLESKKGDGKRKRTEQGILCNSIVAAHLLARPSLTEMHD